MISAQTIESGRQPKRTVKLGFLGFINGVVESQERSLIGLLADRVTPTTQPNNIGRRNTSTVTEDTGRKTLEIWHDDQPSDTSHKTTVVVEKAEGDQLGHLVEATREHYGPLRIHAPERTEYYPPVPGEEVLSLSSVLHSVTTALNLQLTDRS